jgi:hypothetical protein
MPWIFHKALSDKIRMLLSSETKMPMMYMDDAIATIQIMQAPKEIKIRSSYNLAAMSFTPTNCSRSQETHSRILR